jgi:hypothetical protein
MANGVAAPRVDTPIFLELSPSVIRAGALEADVASK